MSRRARRLSATLLVTGSLATVLGLGAGTTQVSAARFVCEPDLQTACAVVFGPLCRKTGCY